jgi:hypothetical protein
MHCCMSHRLRSPPTPTTALTRRGDALPVRSQEACIPAASVSVPNRARCRTTLHVMRASRNRTTRRGCFAPLRAVCLPTDHLCTACGVPPRALSRMHAMQCGAPLPLATTRCTHVGHVQALLYVRVHARTHSADSATGSAAEPAGSAACTED